MRSSILNKLIAAAAWLLLSSTFSVAGEADVIKVTVSNGGAGIFSFDVTVMHADAGWDHYADKWDIVGPKGKVLGTRVLFHPHENEQPFTRSLSGVAIPDGVSEITVRAHDKVHGYGGKTVKVVIKR